MQETSNSVSLLSEGVKSHEVQMLVNRLSCLNCSVYNGVNFMMPVLDLIMIAPIQLQCIFSYTILANPEVEPQTSTW